MGSSTQLNPAQREMPMLGAVEKPIAVDDHLISQCDTMLDAILLCVNLSRFTHTRVRDMLGIDKGHWSRIMTGQANFPTNKMHQLVQVCRNLAPLQWFSHATGVPLVIDKREQRKAELRRELELLESGGPSTCGNHDQRIAA
jgi:hypothetical protein